MKQLWRIWAKALGSKEGLTDKEADAVALFRTGLVVLTVVCELFIIANVIRHW